MITIIMFQENILLSKHSNYQIGGGARFFYVAKNADQIKSAVEKAKKDKINTFILGGGTNLLISDEGFDGLVLKPEVMELRSNESYEVMVGAGISVETLLHYSITHSLSGLEWAGGLPGTVGGAIRGNAGAFAGEMKDCIKEVVSLDVSGKQPRIVKRNNVQCKFSYRNSVFKTRDNFGDSKYWAGPAEIILEATLALKKGDKKSIRKAIEEKIKYRQENHPIDHPNIGSIFKNTDLKKFSKNRHKEFASVIKTDPFLVVPTAHLISQAGLKGVSYGGAMISPKHPNFIVNVLNAKATDVKALIRLAKTSVKEKFDVELEEEIIYL